MKLYLLVTYIILPATSVTESKILHSKKLIARYLIHTNIIALKSMKCFLKSYSSNVKYNENFTNFNYACTAKKLSLQLLYDGRSCASISISILVFYTHLFGRRKQNSDIYSQTSFIRHPDKTSLCLVRHVSRNQVFQIRFFICFTPLNASPFSTTPLKTSL